jgi:hypothetical protein
MHIHYWYWNQTRFIFHYSLLTCDIPFIFYDDIAIDRELSTATLRRRYDGKGSRNTDVQIEDRSQIRKNVDESTTGLASGLRTQISLNVVTDLWIILYFISLDFIVFKINLKSFVKFENTVN